MTQDAKIVNVDNKALLKIVEVVHQSLAAFVNQNSLIATIQKHPETEGLMSIQYDQAEPLTVHRGDTVVFDNQVGDAVTISFPNPAVFGASKLTISKDSKTTVVVSIQAPNGDFTFLAEGGGSGGGSKTITVGPPVED